MIFKEIIRRLTGKLETLACLTLHSTIGSSDQYPDGRKFFQVVHHLLQSTFQRNHECSARLDIIISLTNLQLISFDCFVLFNHRRELVGCLVTRYVDRILNTIQHLYGQPPAGFSSLD